MEINLSIVCPTFRPNLGYLAECLKSIDSAGINSELIIVNDDPDYRIHESIIIQYATKRNQLKVVKNQENKGIVGSYLEGFRASQGKYVCIVDHDDIVDFTKIIPYLADNYDLIYTNEYKFENSESDFRVPYLKPKFDPLSAIFYFYTHHVTLFKGDIVRKVVSEQSCCCLTTFDLWINAQYLGSLESEPSTEHIEHESYGWRVHSQSSSASIDRFVTNEEERIRVCKELLASFGDTGTFAINPYFSAAVVAEFDSTRMALGFSGNLWREKWESLKAGAFFKDGIYSSMFGSLSFLEFAETLERALKIPIYYATEILKNPLVVLSPSCYVYFADDVSFKRHIHGCPFVLKVKVDKNNLKKVRGLYIGRVPHKSHMTEVNLIIMK